VVAVDASFEVWRVKTYLTLWFSSEGASPVEVVARLRSLGFAALRGYHDHVYEWGRKVEVEDVLQIANSVHETLKGLTVLYKLETE
jgi:hypothetical protein